jgi:hypothetical protein
MANAIVAREVVRMGNGIEDEYVVEHGYPHGLAMRAITPLADRSISIQPSNFALVRYR